MRYLSADAPSPSARRDAGPEEIVMAGWLEDGGEYLTLAERPWITERTEETEPSSHGATE